MEQTVMSEFAALRGELAELRETLGQAVAQAEAAERKRSDVIGLAASGVKESSDMVDAKGVGQPFKLQNREQDFAEWSDKFIRYLKASLAARLISCSSGRLVSVSNLLMTRILRTAAR